MNRLFCDICGKEIVRKDETWSYSLKANGSNRRVSMNENIGEVCELCATVINCCVSMRRKGINPDWNK